MTRQSPRVSLSRVIFPAILPAWLTGFATAFAPAVGAYGSMLFIAGNQPRVFEFTSFMIIGKREQYDHTSSNAMTVVMLVLFL